MHDKHSIFKSFKFAFDGFWTIFSKERNFKLQILAGVLAVILGVLLKLDLTEWLDLTLIITLVLILEMVNSSLEEIVDMVSPEIQDRAKKAKDIAAATVLVAAIGSMIVGAILFLPKILVIIGWY